MKSLERYGGSLSLAVLDRFNTGNQSNERPSLATKRAPLHLYVNA